MAYLGGKKHELTGKIDLYAAHLHSDAHESFESLTRNVELFLRSHLKEHQMTIDQQRAR